MYQSKLHTISSPVLFTRVACKSANTWRCQLSEALGSVNPCGLSPSFFGGSLPFVLLLLCHVERPFFGGGVACVYVAYNYTTWGWVGMGRYGAGRPNICYPKQNGYTVISAKFPHGRLYTHLGAFVWIIIFAFLMRTALSHSFFRFQPFCSARSSFFGCGGLFQIFIRNPQTEMGDRCSPCSVADVFFMSRRCFYCF